MFPILLAILKFCTIQRLLTMEVAGGRRRARPARRWNGVVEYDMRLVGLKKGVVMDKKS